MGCGSPQGTKQRGWRSLPSDPVTPPVPWHCGSQTPRAVPRVVEPNFQVGTLRPGLAEVSGPEALRLKAAARDLELSLGWAGHEGCWTGEALGTPLRTRLAAVSGRRFAQLGVRLEARARPPPPPAARPRPGGGVRRGGRGRANGRPSAPSPRPAPRRAAHSRGSGLATVDARRPGGLSDRRLDVRSAPR